MSVIHTARISDITLHSVRSKQLYTPSIDWHRRFEFGKPCVHIPCWRSVIQNFNKETTGNNSQRVTSTSFWHYNLLQATEHKVLWWNTVCIQNSSFPLNVWSACNREIYSAARSAAVCCIRLYTCTCNWWSEFCNCVERRKGNREIIPAIKDHNQTIITDSTEKANILISCCASVFCCDRYVPGIK